MLQEARAEMLRAILRSDSTALIDTLITVLQQDNSLDSRFKLLSIYTMRDMLTEAGTLISDMETEIESIISDTARLNFEERLLLSDIVVQVIQAGGSQDTAVVSAHFAELEAIAGRGYTRQSVQAKIVLEQVGLGEFEEIRLYPQPDEGAKGPESGTSGITDNEETEKLAEEKEFCNIYPNPNDGSMWLEYNIRSKGEIIFYNQAGVELSKYLLDPEERYTLVKTGNFNTGLYLYKVVTDTNILKTGKIAILK